MTTRSQFSCDHMNVRLSGSGDMKAIVNAKSLESNIIRKWEYGSTGSSEESDLRISGSGNVNAELMKTFTGAVTISGSGSGKVDVSNDLTVNITGSGNVQYVHERSYSIEDHRFRIDRKKYNFFPWFYRQGRSPGLSGFGFLLY